MNKKHKEYLIYKIQTALAKLQQNNLDRQMAEWNYYLKCRQLQEFYDIEDLLDDEI